MKRNDFNKQILIYSVTPTADGYGGNTTSATLVDTRWAKVEPLGAGSAQEEYGLDDASRSVRFTIRKNGLSLSADNYVTYRGAEYKIISGPIELKFNNRFYEFVGQEKISKSNTIIGD